MGIFNAKTQSRQDAKEEIEYKIILLKCPTFATLRLCDFATLRLCVEILFWQFTKCVFKTDDLRRNIIFYEAKMEPAVADALSVVAGQIVS